MLLKVSNKNLRILTSLLRNS